MNNTNDPLREALQKARDYGSASWDDWLIELVDSALSQPADAAQGWKLVPVEPDKAALIGEFSFNIELTCSACSFHEPQEDCEVCSGNVQYMQHVTVPWTTIKEIHAAILSASPAAPQAEQPASQGEDGFVGVVIERDGMRGVFTVDVTFGGTPEIGASVYLTPQPDELMAQREELLGAALDWWKQHRPVDWPPELHLTHQDVNCKSPAEIRLALACATIAKVRGGSAL